MAPRKPDTTLHLVSTAYRAAVEPEKFDDLLHAWDQWLETTVSPSDAAFDEIAPIFDHALDLSSNSTSDGARSAFDLVPAPAILFDADGAVLTVNAVAQSFLDREEISAEALAASAGQQAADPADAGQDTPPASPVYRIGGGPGRRSYLVVEAKVTDALLRDHPKAARMVLLSQIDWNDGFEAELSARLNLSGAELRVARGLLEGLTAQEIAAQLGRSLPTVRSHIKVLLQKSGTRRQPELVQLLTILRHVSDIAGERIHASTPGTEAFTRRSLASPAGELPVIEYGDGDLLLYFATSSRPEETAPVRMALSEQGFRVRAPIRPGYDDVPQRGRDSTNEMLEGWLEPLFDPLAEAASPPLIVGHREGGVIALMAAQRLLEAGRPVAGVALISTGAPATALAQWRQSPPSVRRSFLAAHLAPAALTLGYNTAVRLFQSGEEGEDKIVRYFFADSPVDTAKLADPYIYGLMRDNIAYSFNNARQVVSDIALWTRNWSDLLGQVAARCPVLFVHGEEHSFYSCATLAETVATLPEARLLAVEQSGQLALYDAPEAVAAALRDLHGRR